MGKRRGGFVGWRICRRHIRERRDRRGALDRGRDQGAARIRLRRGQNLREKSAG